jgi:glycosyltransferase involved in cell wall biosynthesis
MSAAPLVSVVIPAYNAAAFIEKTLDSVRAQTFTDYEVIVTDDGSADATHAVVEGYFKKHAVSGRCIRQENKRIAGARNTGMRAARGAWIALLDHDDLWKPRKLELVMAEAATPPDAVLIGHDIDVVRDGKRLWTSRKGPATARMYERLLFGHNAVSPSAAVFRRDKALEIGGFREDAEFNTVEDYDFWMRLSRVGRFRFIGQALAEYTIVAGGASRKIEYHHENLEKLLRRHFSEYFGEHPGVIGRLLIRRRLAAVYRSAAGELIESGAPRERQAEYVARMLKTFPLEPKNAAQALLWVLGLPRPGGAAK